MLFRTTRSGAAILVGLVVVGCGPSEEEKEFTEIVKAAKQHYKASDLVHAVMPLFTTYTNRLAPDLSVSELPKEILSLSRYEPSSTFFVTPNKPADRSLWIWWGGSDSHYGISICPFSGRPDTNGMKGVFYPWEDGVTFWRE